MDHPLLLGAVVLQQLIYHFHNDTVLSRISKYLYLYLTTFLKNPLFKLFLSMVHFFNVWQDSKMGHLPMIRCLFWKYRWGTQHISTLNVVEEVSFSEMQFQYKCGRAGIREIIQPKSKICLKESLDLITIFSYMNSFASQLCIFMLHI